MKLTIGEIIDISNSLIYLGEKDNLLCAYAIAKNINKVKKHVEKFSNDKKQMIDKYVVKADNGTYLLNHDKTAYEFGDNLFKFDEEIQKLKDKEIEIELHQILKDQVSIAGEKLIPPAVILAHLDEVVIVDEIIK